MGFQQVLLLFVYFPPPTLSRAPPPLFILTMRMYLLEKNLRLDPDLGPFWHPIPVAEIRNFNINRGRYTQLVPSRAPTGNPTGILYAFHRPADHPDPKRASPTVDLRKGSLIPVALFVKDATALWEAEEEVVRLWSMIEETKGVGMDPYDITKAHYGRAVLDFTAITAAKSLPRPPEQKKGSRSAPAKPQVFSGHWPKCTTELINHVKKGQPWDWGIPTGPPPRVPGASPPPKVLDNAYREMRTGSLLVAAKEQKQREDDKKAMEKANRKPATVAIAFKPHPSVAQPPKKQATLPSLFGRYSNSNTSITLPRTPPTSVESSSRSYEANGEELGELPQPVSSRNAHGSRGSPSCPKINPRASSGARQAYIHDDGELTRHVTSTSESVSWSRSILILSFSRSSRFGRLAIVSSHTREEARPRVEYTHTKAGLRKHHQKAVYSPRYAPAHFFSLPVSETAGYVHVAYCYLVRRPSGSHASSSPPYENPGQNQDQDHYQ